MTNDQTISLDAVRRKIYERAPFGDIGDVPGSFAALIRKFEAAVRAEEEHRLRTLVEDYVLARRGEVKARGESPERAAAAFAREASAFRALCDVADAGGRIEDKRAALASVGEQGQEHGGLGAIPDVPTAWAMVEEHIGVGIPLAERVIVSLAVRKQFALIPAPEQEQERA